jgi:hypothetical protein
LIRKGCHLTDTGPTRPSTNAVAPNPSTRGRQTTHADTLMALGLFGGAVSSAMQRLVRSSLAGASALGTLYGINRQFRRSGRLRRFCILCSASPAVTFKLTHDRTVILSALRRQVRVGGGIEDPRSERQPDGKYRSLAFGALHRNAPAM